MKFSSSQSGQVIKDSNKLINSYYYYLEPSKSWYMSSVCDLRKFHHASLKTI